VSFESLVPLNSQYVRIPSMLSYLVFAREITTVRCGLCATTKRRSFQIKSAWHPRAVLNYAGFAANVSTACTRTLSCKSLVCHALVSALLTQRCHRGRFLMKSVDHFVRRSREFYLYKRRQAAMPTLPSNHDAIQQRADVETPEQGSCIVSMIAPSNPRLALMPRGHHRLCSSCTGEVFNHGRGSPITMLLRSYALVDWLVWFAWVELHFFKLV